MMKKTKHNDLIIYRRDIITYKKYNRHELLRICIKNEKLIIDFENKKPGRGIYIHSDSVNEKNISKLMQKCNRIFKINFKIDDYQKLWKELCKWKQIKI